MKPVSIGYAEGIIEHLMGLKIQVIVDEQLHVLRKPSLKEQLKFLKAGQKYRFPYMHWEMVLCFKRLQ